MSNDGTQENTATATPQPPSESDVAMALLSQDERDALAIDLDDGGLNGEEGAGEVKTGDTPPAEAGKDEGADKTPAKTSAEEPASAAAPASPAQDEAPAPAPAPTPYAYELPADFGQRRADLTAKFDALDKRLADGDIETAEYGRELRALNRQESELDAMQNRADIAREMTEQAKKNAVALENDAWEREIEKLVKSIEDDAALKDKPDYRNDAKAGSALGMQVQALIAARGIDTSRPVANKAELLRAAHMALYFMRTGRAIGDSAPAPAPEKDKPKVPPEVKAKTEKERKPDLSRAAPLVSTLPGSDAPLDTSEFANINSLQGQKYEDAVAKLAQRDPAAYRRFLEQD